MSVVVIVVDIMIIQDRFHNTHFPMNESFSYFRFFFHSFDFGIYFLLVFFYLQLHFDNDREARREREVRLTGSKLDLNFCGAPRATATQLSSSIRTIDSHGNAVSALSSPQSSSSNNNISPTHDESEKFTPMTPAGKFVLKMFCYTHTLVWTRASNNNMYNTLYAP